MTMQREIKQEIEAAVYHIQALSDAGRRTDNPYVKTHYREIGLLASMIDAQLQYVRLAEEGGR